MYSEFCLGSPNKVAELKMENSVKIDNGKTGFECENLIEVAQDGVERMLL
jgi:hypothetical protein